METTKVVMYSGDAAIVYKEHSAAIIVMKRNNIVAIANPTVRVSGNPFIALVKSCDTNDEAYEKWLYLIGKMCKKSCASKYFDNPNTDEHFNNGDQVNTNIRKDLCWFADVVWNDFLGL